MRRIIALELFALALIFAAYFTGYREGRASVQSANDLITAGFTITDPEGYTVAKFD